MINGWRETEDPWICLEAFPAGWGDFEVKSAEGTFLNDLAMRLREIRVHFTNIHGNFP